MGLPRISPKPVVDHESGILKVEHAGNPCVNGLYLQDGYFNGAPRYVHDGVWENKPNQFVVSLCEIVSERYMWFISSVPEGNEAGKHTDIDFYKVQQCSERSARPPSCKWRPAEKGRHPPPKITFLQDEDDNDEDIE